MTIAFLLKRGTIGAAALTLVLGTAYAADRETFPGASPGPPIYAQVIASPDDGWGAIVFYRDPDCIPSSAPLGVLDFGARSCPLVIHGFTVRSEPEPALPDEFHAWGDADMPIWLLSFADLLSAAGDGVVTFGEIESAASLVKGVAASYVEHQQLKGPRAGATVSAHGSLEDGRTFRIRLVEKFDGTVHQLAIEVE